MLLFFGYVVARHFPWSILEVGVLAQSVCAVFNLKTWVANHTLPKGIAGIFQVHILRISFSDEE